jgi:uncharacterized membrane protein
MVTDLTLPDEVRQITERVQALVTRNARHEAAKRRKRRTIGAMTAVGGIGAAAYALRSAGTIEESIEVDVPVATAYNQWTQFEEFPRFMEGVESVRQVDDTHLHWVASVGGKTVAWDAKITEQHPDERVAWTATSGKRNGGVVTFHRLSDTSCKVVVQLEFEPDGVLERVGSAVGADQRRVKGDLSRFKELVESRGASGAWRGEVENASTRA